MNFQEWNKFYHKPSIFWRIHITQFLRQIYLYLFEKKQAELGQKVWKIYKNIMNQIDSIEFEIRKHEINRER